MLVVLADNIIGIAAAVLYFESPPPRYDVFLVCSHGRALCPVIPASGTTHYGRSRRHYTQLRPIGRLPVAL